MSPTIAMSSEVLEVPARRRRRTGKMNEPLIGGLISPSPVCLLPGGHRHLVAGFGKSLRTYRCDEDDKQPRLISGLHGHESGITSAVPVGTNKVASASKDGTVRVWGVEDGTLLRTIDCLRPLTDMAAIKKERVVIATDSEISILSLEREIRDTDPEIPARLDVLSNLNTSNMRRVSASESGSVVATVGGDNIITLGLVNGERITRVTFSCVYNLTTVALSSDGNKLAAGDEKGYIHVYRDLHRTLKMIKKDGGVHHLRELMSSDLHWHSHHVTALRFSKYGNILYSGGCEGVLVIWNMIKTDFGKCKFKPRLGGAIWGIALTDDETTIVLTHADNSVRFIDAVSFQVYKTLRGLSTAHLRTLSPWELTEGEYAVHDNMNFVAEPNSSGCALVSGVGYNVQLYDVLQGANIADIQVVPRNIVMSGNHTGEESGNQPPTVKLVSVSCDRKYMVSVTQEYHPISFCKSAIEPVFIETLKFWNYNGGNSKVGLLSYVENPHGQNDKITDILFHPDMPVLATISWNGTLKIWRAVVDEEDRDGNIQWRCEATEKYRDMHGGKLAFSTDGSVLAASFGAVITVWALEDLVELDTVPTSKDQIVLSSAAPSLNLTFLHTLIHSPKEEVIGHLSFAKKDSPYLLATTCHAVYVWDVLNRCMWWSARLPNRPECTVSDPITGKFALAVKFHSDSLPGFTEKMDEKISLANGNGRNVDAMEDGEDEEGNTLENSEDEEGSAIEDSEEDDDNLNSQPIRTTRRATTKRHRARLSTGKSDETINIVPTDTAIGIFDVMSPAPISATSLPVRTEVAGIGFIGNGQDSCGAKSLFCFDSNMDVVTVPNWDDVETISEVTAQESTEDPAELVSGTLGELVGAPTVRPEKSDMNADTANNAPLGHVEKAPIFNTLKKYHGGSGHTQPLVTNVGPALLNDLTKIVNASQSTNALTKSATPSTNVLNASLRDEEDVDKVDENNMASGITDMNVTKYEQDATVIAALDLYEMTECFNSCFEEDE